MFRPGAGPSFWSHGTQSRSGPGKGAIPQPWPTRPLKVMCSSGFAGCLLDSPLRPAGPGSNNRTRSGSSCRPSSVCACGGRNQSGAIGHPVHLSWLWSKASQYGHRHPVVVVFGESPFPVRAETSSAICLWGADIYAGLSRWSGPSKPASTTARTGAPGWQAGRVGPQAPRGPKSHAWPHERTHRTLGTASTVQASTGPAAGWAAPKRPAPPLGPVSGVGRGGRAVPWHEALCRPATASAAPSECIWSGGKTVFVSPEVGLQWLWRGLPVAGSVGSACHIVEPYRRLPSDAVLAQ